MTDNTAENKVKGKQEQDKILRKLLEDKREITEKSHILLINFLDIKYL